MMLNLNCPAHCKWRRLLGVIPVCIVLILLSSAFLLAQSTAGTGSIQGVVSDPTGAGLSGAKITITNKATAGVIRVTTSVNGTYTSGSMQPGDYKVRIEAKRFQTAEFSVTAQVSVVSAGSIHLQPGQESQVVQAHEAELVVNIEQATVQAVVNGDQIERLPINGRNFMDLAQLEPGIQLQDGSVFETKNGLSSISFQSRFGRAARFEVDGVDISDETAGAATQNIPASAIQEFNLSQSSLDLSTELTSTGAVNVITRSGSNALHGEGFGSFLGNQTAAALPGTLPGAKPSTFQREQFGGRAGGSIIKDKVFWFVDGEGSLLDMTAGEPFSVPFNTLTTALAQPFREAQGEGKVDWQVHDNAHAFLRFNFDQSSDVRPYGSASSVQGFKSENHAPSLTLGYDFSTGPYNHSVRFEYLKFRNNIADRTSTIPAGIDNPIPGLGINIGAPVEGSCQFSNGGAYCGGPNFLAPQATVQSDYDFRYDGSQVLGRHIVRYGATWNRIQAGGFSSFATYPQVGTTGICVIPGESVSNCTTSADPTAYPAEFVQLGNGIGFSTPQHAFGEAGGGLGPDNRFEGYIGDSWKSRKTFTFTYGLRYVRDTGRVDSNLGAEPTLNLWAPGLGDRVRTPNTDFAPIAGFAWDPSGTGKTVIRGGGGLYYDNSLWNYLVHDSPVRQKTGVFSYTPEVCSYGGPTPFTWPSSPGTVGSPVAGGAGVVVAGTNQVQPTFCGGAISGVAGDILALSSAFKAAAANGSGQPNGNFIGTTLSAANANGFDVFDPNYRTARSYQMNLGFEQEFSKGVVFSADYIRDIGERYLIAVDRNHSGAARSYNLANAEADRDAAQLANGCPVGYNEANCMVLKLGQAGAQAAYSAAGLDSNNAVTGGGPCATCAFPGITPTGINNTGNGSGNGALGTLDMLEPVGRSLYSGYQFKLVDSVVHPWPGVKTANLQVAYSLSKFVSQAQDQDSINLATNNDNPLQFTGPNALDRKHQVSFGGTFELPFFIRVSMIGHFYSPLPQNLQLPELTNGGEIFATDWLGSGLGSGAAPEPLPGTQIGQFMRGTDVSNLHTAISNYNTHFAGQMTPAGQCLVGSQSCPGVGPIPVMTQNDMNALGWVMPQLAQVNPDAQNFPWLKTLDLKAAWPVKLKVWDQMLTIEPSASVFNVFNFSNAFLPGNLPSASLLPGGQNGTLAPNAVGGVTGASLTPFRANFQSGTYALGAPRQIEFGLRITF